MRQYNVVDMLVSIVDTVCCEAPGGTFDSRGASVSPHMSQQCGLESDTHTVGVLEKTFVINICSMYHILLLAAPSVALLDDNFERHT